MKKRLTVLATMALCVTVGGVYATWTYAQDTATTGSKEFAISIKGDNTSKGTIAVEANDLTFIVDDAGNYHTKLTITGSATVTYTPDAIATADEITVQYQLSATESWQFTDGNVTSDIFTVTTTAQTLGTGSSWEIKAEDLQDLITMTDFTLETYDEFLKFQEALATGQLTITVSEVEA